MKVEAEQAAKQSMLEHETKKQSDLDAFRFAELEQKRVLEEARIQSTLTIAMGQQEATLEAARIQAESREAESETTTNEPEGEQGG